MAPYPIAAILAGAAAAFAAATLTAGLIARAGFPLPPAHRRIGCIDGLRGYLALSVLVHHFIIWLQVTRLGGVWWTPPVNLFNQFGAAGVALFFMVSGLVFYPRILTGFGATTWHSVYVNRAARILPLAAVSIAIVTAIIAARTGNGLDWTYPRAAAIWLSAWSEPPLLGYADSYRVNAYVLWSLWYEWLFYLAVLPACALAMDLIRPRLPSWIVPASLLGLSLAARALPVPTDLPTYLPLFAIGMLAYEFQRHDTLARRLRGRLATCVALAALMIGMLAAAKPYGAALPLFALFFTCVACGNDFGGLLRTPASLVLGECSYGIYLLHGIVWSLIFVDAAHMIAPLAVPTLPILLPLAAIAVTLITAVTFLLVEAPAMRLAGGGKRQVVLL